MDTVYVLEHSHSPTPDNDEVKLIGVYRTRAAAEAAVARLRDQPGFRDFPRIVEPDTDIDEGFHINELVLDQDSWVGGYITWAEALEEK